MVARRGSSLLGLLDEIPMTDRDVHAPLTMPISEKYRDMGTMVVGKIESGRLRKGSNLLIMPNKVRFTSISTQRELILYRVERSGSHGDLQRDGRRGSVCTSRGQRPNPFAWRGRRRRAGRLRRIGRQEASARCNAVPSSTGHPRAQEHYLRWLWRCSSRPYYGGGSHVDRTESLSFCQFAAHVRNRHYCITTIRRLVASQRNRRNLQRRARRSLR